MILTGTTLNIHIVRGTEIGRTRINSESFGPITASTIASTQNEYVSFRKSLKYQYDAN